MATKARLAQTLVLQLCRTQQTYELCSISTNNTPAARKKLMAESGGDVYGYDCMFMSVQYIVCGIHITRSIDNTVYSEYDWFNVELCCKTLRNNVICYDDLNITT